MNNKLKLFYISMIGLLMVGVLFSVDYIKEIEAERVKSIEIQNKVIAKCNEHRLKASKKAHNLKIECLDLELRNKELQHDIQEVLKEYHVLTELLKNKALTIK